MTLTEAVARGSKGARIIYHEGHLLADATSNQSAAMIRDEAQRLAQQGRVVLVQERVGHKDDGVRRYVAVVADRDWRQNNWWKPEDEKVAA